MRPKQRLRQTLAVKQQLNLKMLQSLRILQMSSLELVSAVKDTVVGNPLLEWDSSWQTRAAFEDAAQGGYLDVITTEDRSDPRDLLTDRLLYAELSADTRRLAEIFIASLDDRGFLAEDEEDWKERYRCDDDTYRLILSALRDAAPGIGTTDISSCLRAQTDDSVLRSIIEDDLALIATDAVDTLAEKYDLSKGEIEEKLRLLQSFHPYPFFHLGHTAEAPAAPPDATLLWSSTGWQIELHDEILPSITVDLHALDHLLGHAEADRFIREKVKEAEELLFSIRIRNATLIRAMYEIATRQTDYLRGIADHPAPFLQKELAEQLDLHPSTVSRTIRDKWILTPRGRIAVEACFARPMPGPGFTAEQLMGELARLQKLHPKASDRILTEKLNASGFPIKRRTVNKYRNELRRREVL